MLTAKKSSRTICPTKGFTIVELLIVIVTIGILAAITTVAYNGIQQRANNTVLANAGRQVVLAIQAFSAGEGHFPRGGNGSTVAIGSNRECSDGASGFFATGYLCTVQDTLVASGYLPAGFSDNLPKNTLYGGTSKYSLMLYGFSGSKATVYYTMSNPSADDTARFNAELVKCGLDPGGTIGPRDSWGMRNGICLNY